MARHRPLEDRRRKALKRLDQAEALGQPTGRQRFGMKLARQAIRGSRFDRAAQRQRRLR